MEEAEEQPEGEVVLRGLFTVGFPLQHVGTGIGKRGQHSQCVADDHPAPRFPPTQWSCPRRRPRNPSGTRGAPMIFAPKVECTECVDDLRPAGYCPER
jgi:hypothetical protein